MVQAGPEKGLSRAPARPPCIYFAAPDPGCPAQAHEHPAGAATGFVASSPAGADLEATWCQTAWRGWRRCGSAQSGSRLCGELQVWPWFLIAACPGLAGSGLGGLLGRLEGSIYWWPLVCCPTLTQPSGCVLKSCMRDMLMERWGGAEADEDGVGGHSSGSGQAQATQLGLPARGTCIPAGLTRLLLSGLCGANCMRFGSCLPANLAPGQAWSSAALPGFPR